MNRRWVNRGQRVLLILAAGFIGGCAGTGEVFNLDIRALPAPDSLGKVSQVHGPQSAFVRVFEDGRANRDRLGTRTHFWGGATSIALEGGHAGEKISRVLADYLTQRGLKVGVESPGVAGIKGTPDVIVSGKVVDLSANAKSRFGSTLIVTTIKLTIQIQHSKVGKVRGLQVNDVREDSVGWFEPTDLEDLVNRMVQESLWNVLDDLNLTGKETNVGQKPLEAMPPAT